jgi:hypothetical protein
MWSVVCIVRSYGLDGPGFEYRQEQGSFLLSTAPRTSLKPTHLSIGWAQLGL